jgi:hypothetical protein
MTRFAAVIVAESLCFALLAAGMTACGSKTWHYMQSGVSRRLGGLGPC